MLIFVVNHLRLTIDSMNNSILKSLGIIVLSLFVSSFSPLVGQSSWYAYSLRSCTIGMWSSATIKIWPLFIVLGMLLIAFLIARQSSKE